MVKRKIIETVKKYLQYVADAGISVDSGVIFGSCARNEELPDSDIDLLVVSPDFDGPFEHKLVDLLWGIRRFVDSHIEPHAVGVKQFLNDETSPLIGIAREEGIIIPFTTSVVMEKQANYGTKK